MTLIPAFEIGWWNAWILQAVFLLVLMAPEIVLNKAAKERTNRAMGSVPLSKNLKILATSTHAVIMPVALIYSIFLPLKTGVWLYVGIPIFVLPLIMTPMVSYSFAATPLGQPVTGGVYRISRHPIYLSGFLLYAGIGIACASWVFLLFAVLWIVFLGLTVPAEERFLLEKYGDAYRKYMNRTPAWLGIPKLGGSKGG